MADAPPATPTPAKHTRHRGIENCSGAIESADVYNNTIHIGPGISQSVIQENNTTRRDVRYRNNIVVKTGAGTASMTLRRGGYVLDHNDFVNVTGVPAGAGITADPLLSAPGTANQRWTFTAAGDGSYTVKNVHSGLCMDVDGGSTSGGAAVIQWTCHGGLNQRWVPTATTGGYTLTPKSGTLVLTASGATDGAALTQQPAAGTATQRWTFTAA